jgi:hypothetical protein
MCVLDVLSVHQIVILDFKTSNFIHDSYALQLAAYVNAYKEVFGDDPEVGENPQTYCCFRNLACACVTVAVTVTVTVDSALVCLFVCLC